MEAFSFLYILQQSMTGCLDPFLTLLFSHLESHPFDSNKDLATEADSKH